jgi:flagella basal body P-ring formation protein FlgA
MRTILFALALSAAPFWRVYAADAASGASIPVPAHDIERGEVIMGSDLLIQTIAPDRMRPGMAMTEAALTGREARRLLRAGEPVRADDVRMPILVAKGSTVTMVFNLPGISLTATGRAMSEGGMGETVSVQNPVSFRQVSCVVTGVGEVRAGDATPVTVAANNP